ncbi:Fe(3+)-binding periplasmic protein [Phycisphaerales bacterium]|nr:Fe(3+)-binding periplasmic protein [Phycisphaerales bacterium]
MANTRRWKQNTTWKFRDVLDQWRGLAQGTRLSIALGSLGIAAVCLGLSWWVVFSPGSGPQDLTANTRVVLYTSTDAFLVTPIVKKFEEQTGLTVQVVGDTEATKTTGLVERLLAEKAAPRCDVWWSNEASGTVMLAKAGVLAEYSSKEEAKFGAAWPRHLRAQDRTWYGFAQRARVIAYNTNRVTKQSAPKTLRELTRPEWSGRVGMARPQFGTTRTHIAALLVIHGPDATREWLAGMRGNGVKIFDGNSSVARALSVGEIAVGLMDTDDALSGKANAWPIDFNYEILDKPGTNIKGLPSLGPVVIPNTVGLIRGGPHPNEALRLANFLLSEEVERMLATSDSRNVPIREGLAKELKIDLIPNAAPATPEQCAQRLDEADRLIAEFFPLQ